MRTEDGSRDRALGFGLTQTPNRPKYLAPSRHLIKQINKYPVTLGHL